VSTNLPLEEFREVALVSMARAEERGKAHGDSLLRLNGSLELLLCLAKALHRRFEETRALFQGQLLLFPLRVEGLQRGG
jgi:hypothetical protein